MSQHTPDVVVAEKSKLNNLWTAFIGPNKKMLAAVIDPYGLDDTVAEANARFIARAWNNHDDLFDALDRLLKQVDERCGGRASGNSEFVAVADVARTLLDKVRAES